MRGSICSCSFFIVMFCVNFYSFGMDTVENGDWEGIFVQITPRLMLFSEDQELSTLCSVSKKIYSQLGKSQGILTWKGKYSGGIRDVCEKCFRDSSCKCGVAKYPGVLFYKESGLTERKTYLHDYRFRKWVESAAYIQEHPGPGSLQLDAYIPNEAYKHAYEQDKPGYKNKNKNKHSMCKLYVGEPYRITSNDNGIAVIGGLYNFNKPLGEEHNAFKAIYAWYGDNAYEHQLDADGCYRRKAYFEFLGKQYPFGFLGFFPCALKRYNQLLRHGIYTRSVTDQNTVVFSDDVFAPYISDKTLYITIRFFLDTMRERLEDEVNLRCIDNMASFIKNYSNMRASTGLITTALCLKLCGNRPLAEHFLKKYDILHIHRLSNMKHYRGIVVVPIGGLVTPEHCLYGVSYDDYKNSGDRYCHDRELSGPYTDMLERLATKENIYSLMNKTCVVKIDSSHFMEIVACSDTKYEICQQHIKYPRGLGGVAFMREQQYTIINLPGTVGSVSFSRTWPSLLCKFIPKFIAKPFLSSYFYLGRFFLGGSIEKNVTSITGTVHLTEKRTRPDGTIASITHILRENDVVDAQGSDETAMSSFRHRCYITMYNFVCKILASAFNSLVYCGLVGDC
jgi:hypothetical protein